MDDWGIFEGFRVLLVKSCDQVDAPQFLFRTEGAYLCQAQPAKHKLFGSNGAIFFLFDLLMVVLLNC